MELADSERVSRAVTTHVGAGGVIGVCASKMARDNTLFPGPLLAGSCESCSELAVVESVNGLKTAS